MHSAHSMGRLNLLFSLLFGCVSFCAATSLAMPLDDHSDQASVENSPSQQIQIPNADPLEDLDEHPSEPVAEPQSTAQPPAPVYVPMRFSDGPRRVPTARGGSALRAQALGLGTRETAGALLLRAPRSEWIRAAAWTTRTASTAGAMRILWPVDTGRFVRGFGLVRRTIPDLPHNGLDIAESEGSTVRAVADGIVAYSDNGLTGYGNVVLIVHANGWVSLYAHNYRTTVQAGWRVRRGERIALLGNTGQSRGPHVHFELRQGGRPVDPAPYLDGGPRYISRIGERAASRGHAPPLEPLRSTDRVEPTPLAPALLPTRAVARREATASSHTTRRRSAPNPA